MALLDTNETPSPQGWALASGVLFAALLDRLVATGVLTAADAGRVVSDAKGGLGALRGGHVALADAAKFLTILAKKFPAA
jgi:hypothetical protein